MNLRLSLAGTAAFLKGHPWIAAEAQLGYRVPPEAGTLLRVQDSQGNFLGWALSEGPGRFPAFRQISRLRHSDFGKDWWQGVVEQALAKRRSAPLDERAPQRLLNGEVDGVPGLVCDACGPLAFLSVSAESLNPFLPLIEEALIQQTRLRGLWRRFLDASGAWGPWHRTPLAPLSPARFEAVEGALRVPVDLDVDARGDLPPWPVERRAWRAWAAANCPGKRTLVLGSFRGEAAAAKASGPVRFEHLEDGFVQGLADALAWRPERILLDVPIASKESFGHFDAAKHGPRLLKTLAQTAAPDALVFLTSAHPSLAGLEAWNNAWLKAEAAVALTQVLAPGPDCPELSQFPEGRRQRAFVYSLAPQA